MKIIIGSDHAGYELKEELVKHLQENYKVVNCGPFSKDSVDYPDYAKAVCQEMTADTVGILVCYTGIGMSIAANKFKGIRAALVGSLEDATLTREHNNSNVLCLSAKNTNSNLAKQIVDIFLTTAFTGGRHENRVNKIIQIEQEN